MISRTPNVVREVSIIRNAEINEKPSEIKLFIPKQKMSEEKQIWDSNTQTFHGGQDWRLVSNYKEDFSVTTNPLGIPKKGRSIALLFLKSVRV